MFSIKSLGFTAVCIIATFLLPHSAFAADVSAYYSYWSVEDQDDASGGGLKFAFNMTTMLELEMRFAYFDDITEGDRSNLSATPVELGLSLNTLPGEVINPYGSAGVGYYLFDPDRGDSEEAFGAYVGGGVEIRIWENLNLMAEAFYRWIDDISFSDIDRDDDLESNGAVANLGLTYRF